MNTINKVKKWFALIEVKPSQGNNDLGDAEGAYVTIGCFANSAKQYMEIVNERLKGLGYEVIEISELEDEDQAIMHIKDPDTEIHDINKKLDQGIEFEWGTFFPY